MPTLSHLMNDSPFPTPDSHSLAKLPSQMFSLPAPGIAPSGSGTFVRRRLRQKMEVR
jgi:hypothetical protein